MSVGYDQLFAGTWRTVHVAKKKPEYHYPARPLLGFSATDQALIRDSLPQRVLVSAPAIWH
ncbi:phage virion morphogenesis protein [Collimonas silvisoli]|uniref:phage virion morphogenesis protein n=1 Tax=Collimonas silvisoli TaxID=2825884 RepID=UPI002E7876E5|nr:phage virion morphogenesis protein [Collimonas silvisoli]